MAVSIADIIIYPIKSLGGFSVSEWPVLSEGLAYDRQWMLVDENGLFLTQRNLPEMALLKIQPFAPDAHYFEVLSVKSGKRIQIPVLVKKETFKQVKVWDDLLNAIVYDEKTNTWFSNELGFPCFLVKKDESAIRQVDRKYAEEKVSTGFSDGFPVLVLSKASLADLNNRLEIPVPMNRFRPNIVLDGTSAFEEDITKEMILKEAQFSLVKPCGRCIVTTIDQDTSEKTREPLKTLASFRSHENKILFGMNALVKTTGKIQLNEEVHLVQSS